MFTVEYSQWTLIKHRCCKVSVAFATEEHSMPVFISV